MFTYLICSMEELAGIPESHCEMVYSEIGREDLIGLKRDKRRALASDSLKCLVRFILSYFDIPRK